jgi:putative ABC transport system ATP-binding protein
VAIGGDVAAPSAGGVRTLMMELDNVTKVYQQGRRTVEAVRGVNLRVVAGEYVSIMGPSGSGKSTLMHMMGALDTPSTGRALFDGKDLNALSDHERSRLRRTRIGFVFQFFNLLPTLTAVENVALPLLLGGVGRGKALKAASASLDRIGMTYRAGHYPEEMSGGEMQRIAIARALVGDPEAILCDEPTGNLDSANSQAILQMLRGLPESGRRSVVMVTHDPNAAAVADRIVHIRDGLIESIEDQSGQGSGVRGQECADSVDPDSSSSIPKVGVRLTPDP